MACYPGYIWQLLKDYKMNLIKTLRITAIILLVATVSACVSTQTVSRNQANDSTLSCDSIATRLGEVQAAKSYAKSNQGVSGANVAAALLFLPALIANNANTSSMIKSMEARELTLNGYYQSRQCTSPIPKYGNKEIKRKIKAGDTLESFS